MYRFLLRPRWLLGHVLAVAAVVGFVSLGFWQLRRLDERRELNAVVERRGDAPARPLAALLRAADGDAQPLQWRRATVTGTYAPGAEVLLTARSRAGRPGHHVLTPLVTGDDRAVIVDRGWVPYQVPGPPVRLAAPPGGQVTVHGVVFTATPTDQYGRTASGRLEFVSAVDLDRLAGASPAPLAPVYVQLSRQSPPQPGSYPVPARLPALTEGSHLSYAGQWFLFAAVVVLGYPVLLARTAREQRGDGHHGEHLGDPPATAPVAGRGG
ncbi:SURF1 family protein [soil metagenome]